VIYAAVGSEIIGVDVNDVENIGRDREGTEEDIAGSGVGEENVKVGSDCGLGVSVNSSSPTSSRNGPSGDRSDTLARMEANVSENARFAFPNRGVVGSFRSDAVGGFGEVERTPVFPLQVRLRGLAPTTLEPVGSSMAS